MKIISLAALLFAAVFAEEGFVQDQKTCCNSGLLGAKCALLGGKNCEDWPGLSADGNCTDYGNTCGDTRK